MGLEHTPCNRREQRRTESGERRAIGGCSEGDACELEHTNDPRSQDGSSVGTVDNNGLLWASGLALHCTDGKSRRIEPSAFPLAHGVPAVWDDCAVTAMPSSRKSRRASSGVGPRILAIGHRVFCARRNLI